MLEIPLNSKLEAFQIIEFIFIFFRLLNLFIILILSNTVFYRILRVAFISINQNCSQNVD